MRRAVADPGGAAAVEMDGGAVLGVELAGIAFDGVVARLCRCIQRAGAGAHDRLVDGDEEVAIVLAGASVSFRGERVGELDAHRAVALGDDDRAHEVDAGRSHGVAAVGRGVQGIGAS